VCGAELLGFGAADLPQVTVHPSFTLAYQGWRVPPGEAPIASITVRVYPIEQLGLDLLQPNEQRKLDEYTVLYIEV
jgi:hypothetical protein